MHSTFLFFLRSILTLSTTSLRSLSSTMESSSAITKLEDVSEAYRVLVEKLETVTQLNRVQSVLNYDRMVFMNQNAETAKERGAQNSALAALIHEKSVDTELKKLIEQAQADIQVNVVTDSTLFTDETRLLELEYKSFVENERVSPELAAKEAALSSTAYAAWMKAKEGNNFSGFEEILKDCFDTAKEVATAKRGDKNISLYTQMLDQFEMGFPATRIDEVFGVVQSALVPLIASVLASPYKPSTGLLKGTFPVDAQKNLSKKIVAALGFHLERGRMDVSAHPFTSSSSPMDVRITSRFTESEWYPGLAGSIHEGGHAMYEQSLKQSALSIDQALSMGTHESQSLFWERHIGLSLPFWKWAINLLKEDLPTVDATPNEVYKAINAVKHSLIRVDADELTYPLHVILRYNIERDIVEGRLDVGAIPSRWKKDMKDLLNIDVPDDTNGCLQDVHWSCMAIGYFPTYLLGSAAAAQLAHFCKRDIPNFNELVSNGEFTPIKTWLTEKIHRHGRRYKSLDDLLENQLGEKLNPGYFIDYLTTKYKDIYNILIEN